jgi:hypothetical protein
MPAASWKERGAVLKKAFFGVPALGTVGNLGRDTYQGPGFANVDFSLFKNIKIPQINEQSMFQIRFEFFNLFNSSSPLVVSWLSTTFGRVTSITSPRVMRIGMRVSF